MRPTAPVLPTKIAPVTLDKPPKQQDEQLEDKDMYEDEPPAVITIEASPFSALGFAFTANDELTICAFARKQDHDPE